jgi:hypothetical protein
MLELYQQTRRIYVPSLEGATDSQRHRNEGIDGERGMWHGRAQLPVLQTT